MSKEEQHSQINSFLANEEDWQRLTHQINNNQFTELVKHDRHLQQHEFRGFRPTHLQWEHVPEIVAKHAQGCTSTRNFLIKSWLSNNEGLLIRAKSEVSIDHVEDGVVRILASMSFAEKERDRLLWALILDDRPEVQQALVNGLHDEIIDDTSHLITKAKLYAAQHDLEESRAEIVNFRTEKDIFAKQLKQVSVLEATIYDLTDNVKLLESELADERLNHNNASQELSNAQSEIKQLLEILTTEQSERAMLENIFVRMQQEESPFVEQVRQLENELAQAKNEIRLLLDNRQEAQITESLLRFDAAWQNATTNIARHLRIRLLEQAPECPIVSLEEKWHDWQGWQQRESDLVRTILLSLPQSLTAKDLYSVETAQQILLLRWYLLEWLKSTLFTTLNANSPVLQQVEGYQQ